VNFNRDKSSLISITEQVILYKGTEYIAQVFRHCTSQPRWIAPRSTCR